MSVSADRKDATRLEPVWLGLIGLAAGLLGGLLGIGGSIVMIPAMTEVLGENQHLYQASALIVSFFVGAPALVQHLRAGVLSKRVLRSLVPAAMAGAVVGVVTSELPVFRGDGDLYLTGLFGLFLLGAAARDVVSLVKGVAGSSDEVDSARRQTPARIGLLVGLPTGFMSGLLGVGGGVVSIPLQRRVLGMPLRQAIANSAATIVGLSVVGAVVKHAMLVRHHPSIGWSEPARLAMLLVPTAIVGASIGARLTHVLPIRAVRIAFAVLLVVAGARMVERALEQW